MANPQPEREDALFPIRKLAHSKYITLAFTPISVAPHFLGRVEVFSATDLRRALLVDMWPKSERTSKPAAVGRCHWSTHPGLWRSQVTS